MKYPQFKRSDYIRGGIAVASVLVIAGFAAWASALNKGIILSLPDHAKKSGNATRRLDGVYISLMYSSIYRLKKLPPADNDYEMYDFTANPGFEKHLAVDVSRLDGGLLNNDTSYTARATHPELYARSDITVAGKPAVLFIKNDNTERTVFVPKGDRLAVLAFVSTGGLEDLTPEITNTLNSFHWKQ